MTNQADLSFAFYPSSLLRCKNRSKRSLASRAWPAKGGSSHMATTVSFKQTCPSCEAMVPIRDMGLVGRKIDCPKCKYRFVVEAPPEEKGAESKPAKKGKPSATTTKPGAKAGTPKAKEEKANPSVK